jgi:hypothetical protein
VVECLLCKSQFLIQTPVPPKKMKVETFKIINLSAIQQIADPISLLSLMVLLLVRKGKPAEVEKGSILSQLNWVFSVEGLELSEEHETLNLRVVGVSTPSKPGPTLWNMSVTACILANFPTCLGALWHFTSLCKVSAFKQRIVCHLMS